VNIAKLGRASANAALIPDPAKIAAKKLRLIPSTSYHRVRPPLLRRIVYTSQIYHTRPGSIVKPGSASPRTSGLAGAMTERGKNWKQPRSEMNFRSVRLNDWPRRAGPLSLTPTAFLPPPGLMRFGPNF
jgi:hypothetical protein